MLSRIVELELAMKEKENTITSLCKEFDENKEQYEERINSKLHHVASNKQFLLLLNICLYV